MNLKEIEQHFKKKGPLKIEKPSDNNEIYRNYIRISYYNFLYISTLVYLLVLRISLKLFI